MRNILLSILTISSLSTFSFGTSGKEILDKVEANLTSAKDQQSLVEVILGSGNKIDEKRIMKIWSAGKEKRIVKFVSPDSVKGIGVLSLPNEEMYVYLPAYKRTRAIQGNMKNQNFQGTDFSYREIGSFNYSKDYDSKLISQSDGKSTLELTRKQNSDAEYDKVILEVDTVNYLPIKLEMYSSGSLKKILKILKSENKNNYWILSHIRMEDLRKNHFTEIIMKEVEFDKGLENKGIFTKRFLEEPIR